MNADHVLIEDHNRLRGLLGELKSTTTDDSERRRELLDQLVGVLTVHVQIEDELFIPRLRRSVRCSANLTLSTARSTTSSPSCCAPIPHPRTSVSSSTGLRRRWSIMPARKRN